MIMRSGLSVRPHRDDPAPGVTASSPRRGYRGNGHRPVALGLTVAIHCLAIVLFLIRWNDSSVAPAHAPKLSVFDVAPPAAPPPPAGKRSPDPIKVAVPHPVHVEPDAEPPKIALRTERSAAPVVSPPVTDQRSPTTETPGPEAKPFPPTPERSSAKPTWEGAVLAALNKAKRYPREASFRRQQGVPWIRFVMNRDGKVLSSQLERSSSIRALDQEAIDLPKRAQPLPKPPETVVGQTIELVVPIEFFLSVRP